jgi:hypothetical protein
MRTRSVPYQSLEMVDTNAQARNAYLNSCTAQLCVKRFGNQECETASGAATSAPVTKPMANDVTAPVSKSATSAATATGVRPAKSGGTAPAAKTAPKSPASSEDDDDDDDD